jgi:hypothetical protein
MIFAVADTPWATPGNATGEQAHLGRVDRG